MSITEKSRVVLNVLRDPTPDLIAGIAGIVFAQGDFEPYLFRVLTETGEFEGIICRFDYEQYYTRNSTNDWVVYGTAIPQTVFKLCKPLHNIGTIEIVRFDIPEDEEDEFTWQDVVWTI